VRPPSSVSGSAEHEDDRRADDREGQQCPAYAAGGDTPARRQEPHPPPGDRPPEADTGRGMGERPVGDDRAEGDQRQPQQGARGTDYEVASLESAAPVDPTAGWSTSGSQEPWKAATAQRSVPSTLVESRGITSDLWRRRAGVPRHWRSAGRCACRGQVAAMVANAGRDVRRHRGKRWLGDRQAGAPRISGSRGVRCCADFGFH
jgi:hypothetical protein